MSGFAPERWAELVRADLGRAVEGFIAAGRHLTEAKADLPHGSFEGWVREQVGISPQTARKLMAIAQHPALANRAHVRVLPPHWGTLAELEQLEPAALEQAIERGEITPGLDRDQARALVRRAREPASHQPPPDPSRQPAWTLEHGDFREVLEELPAGSVDTVITDPPYSREHLPLYSDLAEHAAKWLRPGGLCAVMTGQTHLLEVGGRLGEHLDYHWTLAYLTPGGRSPRLWHRKVNTFWKPVLLFANGAYDGGWFGDVARSEVNDNDKRYHDWGQSESGMADLVKRLTRPGQLVCDPLMGAGTTGVVSLALGRRFVGCDVDPHAVATARHRLACQL